MKMYATIKELINSVNDMEISFRNLHGTAYIKNSDDSVIRIPYQSVTAKYKTFFEKAIVLVNFDEAEMKEYQYKPKALSLALYNTTELWSALLELNDCISLLDFKLTGTVKLYEPETFRKLLNEVMILEGIIK